MRWLLLSTIILSLFNVCAYATLDSSLVIYNVAFTIRGLNDQNWCTIPLKAYMVAEYDIMGIISDVNIILYGKDSDANKAYIILNDEDSNDFIDIEYNNHGDYAHLYIEGYSPFYLATLMLGKLRYRDVGMDETKKVFCSFEGNFTINDGMLLDDNRQIIGNASIKAVMSATLTKTANQQHLTKDEVVDQLRALLELKGYIVFIPET